jgi:hypothetical protein
MDFSFRLTVTAALTLAAGVAWGQDQAVVRYDATRRNLFCIKPNAFAPDAPCVPADNPPSRFLVQGQRNQLRVVNRKFLTQYSFYVTQVTPVTNFPIEDLNEAANLSVGTALGGPSAVSKGAVPKGLATSGTLQLRTAQDLVGELLNPATASNPANEIASDWIVVKRELESVINDARGFRATWDSINNSAIPSLPRQADSDIPISCLPAYGAPTLVRTLDCLQRLYRQETTGTFNWERSPYTNEDAFRRLMVNDNDAIQMVSSLGATLSQQMPQLSTQLSAFDGDMQSLRADMNTLSGNVQAAQDATSLLPTITPTMTRAQIKLKLIQTLNGGSKPVLDDAELNLLTEQYYMLTRSKAALDAVSKTESEINQLWPNGVASINSALATATEIGSPIFTPSSACAPYETVRPNLGCLGREVDARFSFLLDRDHTLASVDLPIEVTAINAAQSNLLARANQIYDNSRIDVPLDLPINLNGNGGNLRLYFTIYETEAFPRFAIPPNTSATTPIVSATPATLAAAPPTTTTTTTTATATTTTTTTPTQPSGNAVASGVLDVHDRYKATMVAAFAFSPNLKEISIQSTPITSGTTSDGTVTCSSTTPCSEAIEVHGSPHASVILGISFHPGSYDTFPHAYDGTGLWGHAKHAIGVFGGLSVQNLNDYYAGIDYQFAHGIQLMGGANFLRTDALAPGYKNGNIYAGSPTFGGPQHFKTGAYFGIGLNLSIFRKAFGAVTGLGTSATTGGS